MSWHMPDGTKTSNRPKDGAIFNVYDSRGAVATWQWDDVKEQWFNVSSGRPTRHNTITFNIPPPPNTWNIEIHRGPELGQCECGSEKVGSNKHSTWCKKFDPRS